MTLKIAELFAGIGAWKKALDRLGIEHETVAAIESDKKAMAAYNLIHKTKFEATDIRDIDPVTFPDHDIMFYSPPCQAFSRAGKEGGFEDARGTLFFDAFKVIQAKKPKIAVMENVKGLTQNKFKYEFETMLQMLKDEGYENHWKVLNAKDYGIPHSRDRVFIVSIRNDIKMYFKFPEKIDKGLRLGHLLEDKVDDRFYLEEEKHGDVVEIYKTRQLNLDDFDSSKTNRIMQLGLLNIYGVQQIRRVYDPSGICPSLTTMQGGNRQPKVVVIEDGEYKVRKLTPFECMRLMGFDDEDYYVLKNNKYSNSQIYKVAGNSIVVNVIEEICKNLISNENSTSEKGDK